MDTEFFDEDALYRWEFKNKGYAHFDSEFCKDRVEKLLDNLKKTNRMSHTFYPFIRFKMPKSKRNDGKVYIEYRNPRHIMHTARIDANLYSFYRTILMNKYESLLCKLQIANCVIAYRKIKVDNHSSKGMSNVHFANAAFEEIKRQTQEFGKCSAIAMDISKFFDNLDHGIIKQQWCRVMEYEHGLPEDHFSIFKNVTQFRYIDKKALEKKLHIKFGTLLSEGKKQICSPPIFRQKVLPFLSEKNKIGIPQGTAISDVIANMYLLDFDVFLDKFAKKYTCYYRRYSDDILLICPSIYESKARKLIAWIIQRKAKLSINHKKTLISRFELTPHGITCASYKSSGGSDNPAGKLFLYLGLSFDGVHKNIRQSSISTFYQRLSYRIKKEVNIAYLKLEKKGNSCPNEKEIYKMISFDLIRNSYMENRNKQKNFLGNFFSYVQLISKVTENHDVLNLFSDLGYWIKERAKRYCEIKATYKS